MHTYLLLYFMGKHSTEKKTLILTKVKYDTITFAIASSGICKTTAGLGFLLGVQ